MNMDGTKEANVDILKTYQQDKKQFEDEIKKARKRITKLRNDNVEKTLIVLQNQGKIKRNEYEITQQEALIKIYRDELLDIITQINEHSD